MTPVRDRSLHVVLWIAQWLLAGLITFTGIVKLASPIDVLARQMPWVTDVPLMLVHVIGACEIAGAAGLVLPGLTGIQPGLTPLAAVGVMVLMTLASLFHFARGEFSFMLLPMTLAVAAAFIAWGRGTRVSRSTGLGA